eukprot:2438436-Amphidinium_carterae.1
MLRQSVPQHCNREGAGSMRGVNLQPTNNAIISSRNSEKSCIEVAMLATFTWCALLMCELVIIACTISIRTTLSWHLAAKTCKRYRYQTGETTRPTRRDSQSELAPS